jgi:hypothetical protein
MSNVLDVACEWVASYDIMRPMPHALHRVPCAVLAFLLGSVPARAFAAASAHLVYVRGPGAEQCPGEEAVRKAVGARLGYDPFFAWAHDTLFAAITRSDGVFRVEIRLVDRDNHQTGARDISVRDDDCSAVIDAMGLTISLTIDPSSLTRSSPPPPAPAPAPAPEPQVTQPAPLVTESEPPAASPPEPITTHVGLGAVGSFGAAPAPSAGGTVFAGVLWRALSLDVEARADLTAGAGVPSLPGVSVASSLVVGSIVPCVHLGPGFVCAVVSAGTIDATSTARVQYDARQPWWAAGARIGAELPLSRALSLRLYGELLATMTPYQLAIDNVTFDLSPLAGGIGLALAWRFL